MARKFTPHLDLAKDEAVKLTASMKANEQAGIENLPLEKSPENFPTTATKTQRVVFGRRLQHLAQNKGWNQSDTARRSGLSKQVVSSYWTGRSWPSPLNAGKLAHAFGITRGELIPEQTLDAMTGEEWRMELRDVPNNPQSVLIDIRMIVPIDVGVRVLTLVHSYHATNRT